jgi:malonate decarboxylase beta subunit
MGEADALVEDDAEKIAATIREYVQAGPPSEHRSEQVKLYRDRIAALDTSRQIDPKSLRQEWNGNNTSGGER